MATLGQNTSNGDFFQLNGTYNQVQAVTFTVPSPGIIITALHGWAQSNTGGTIANCRLYCWEDVSGANDYGSGNWLYRSNLFTLGTAKGQIDSSSVAANTSLLGSDGYIKAGNHVNFGIYVPSFPYSVFGSGSGQSNIGDGGDSGFHYRGVAGSGFGQMEAWCDYTVLAAPTLSSASPAAAPAGQSVTLVGTHLLHTTGITCCGVTVTSYTITDDSHITMTVPTGAAGAGNIVVTTPAGNASLAFVAGQLYGDTGTTFASGVLVYADTGTSWVSSGVQVWADDGTSWHQIG